LPSLKIVAKQLSRRARSGLSHIEVMLHDKTTSHKSG
jgi:hypothetical protein